MLTVARNVWRLDGAVTRDSLPFLLVILHSSVYTTSTISVVCSHCGNSNSKFSHPSRTSRPIHGATCSACSPWGPASAYSSSLSWIDEWKTEIVLISQYYTLMRTYLAKPHLLEWNVCIQLELYRGLGIYDVKGSVHVFLQKLHYRGERGRKGRSAKFQNKTYRTFDIIII